jgi:hypothetical protein
MTAQSDRGPCTRISSSPTLSHGPTTHNCPAPPPRWSASRPPLKPEIGNATLALDMGIQEIANSHNILDKVLIGRKAAAGSVFQVADTSISGVRAVAHYSGADPIGADRAYPIDFTRVARGTGGPCSVTWGRRFAPSSRTPPIRNTTSDPDQNH